ncbi:MAG: molybdenum cofactor carrier [Nitrospirae bacterium]|nr:MAG: molybdenum cofactor carrier [Nitrospirota bacterium]
MRSRTRLRRIISGGQSGVDRAALDAAIDCGLQVGGWCPRGRKAEDGPLPLRYPLKETPSPHPAQRTAWNVREADGTLIFSPSPLSGGTALTLKIASRLQKPCLLISLEHPLSPQRVCSWIDGHGIATLNVAGPRESSCPGIYQHAYHFLRRVFQRIQSLSSPIPYETC